jgi:hypothetical protein
MILSFWQAKLTNKVFSARHSALLPRLHQSFLPNFAAPTH